MKTEKKILEDAVKSWISMRGEALLQWDFYSYPSGHSYPRRSVQLPEDVIDKILEWRDKEYT